MHALVVDDSSAMRMVLKKIMRDAGYEVSEAVDGSDALNKLKEVGSVELMLVDWNMPVMDGLEFVQAVRKDDAYAASTIIMVTTEDGIDRISIALEAGANEYVMKPFTTESLIEKLQLLGLAT